MNVCPYKTYRYHRGCSITVWHLHYQRWKYGAISGTDDVALTMGTVWWPARRERAG